MLMMPASFVEYRDVIGFWRRSKIENTFLAGKVVKIGYHDYPAGRRYTFTIRLANGEEASTSFGKGDKVLILSLDDDKNPARTRNNRAGWESLGIMSIDGIPDETYPAATEDGILI